MYRRAFAAALAVLMLLSAFSPLCLAAPKADAGSRVDRIYNNMTQEERIAQMLMIRARSWKGQGAVTELDQDLRELYAQYKFGAFLSCGENLRDTFQMLRFSKDIQAATVSRGGVPMFLAAEHEGGSIRPIPTGTAMPGSMAAAASGDFANARTEGAVIGEELAALAYNCTLAPDLGICDPEYSTAAGSLFGDLPASVGTNGREFLAGLNTQNVIGCIKYYPCRTGVRTDPATGCPVTDKTWDELADSELVPFQTLIEAGAEMVMVSHILCPAVDAGTITATRGEHSGKQVGTPATLSNVLLTQRLRGEMGFDGVICTDSMAADGISSFLSSPERAARAINAGADLLCTPLSDEETETPEKFRQNMDALIAYIGENVPKGRIEDAVKRILTLKEKKGILDYEESGYTYERAISSVGSDQHRSDERDMAAEGVTLVKNAGGVLPLHIGPNSRVLALVQEGNGDFEKNHAAQFAFGWNRARDAGLIPSNARFDVVLFDAQDWDDAEKLTAIDNADCILTDSVVCAKDGMGYETWRTAAPKKYTDYAKECGKKSVVISADAPYDVQLFPNADAILAAYNPAGCTDDWKTVLQSGATTSLYAMGVNLTAAVEAVFGVCGVSGRLPVNIYAFDTASKSYDKTRIIYNRGFGIEYDPITSISEVELRLAFSQAEYSGREIRPAVMVLVQTKSGTKVLAEGRDYSLTYQNNIAVGLASAVITGMGSYVGEKTAYFEIVARQPGGGTNPPIPSVIKTLLFGFEGLLSQNGSFSDVLPTDWFYENVRTAAGLSLMIGKSEKHFAPQDDMTVAEAFAIASRLHSLHCTGKLKFVQGTPWYRVYADYCMENGIADASKYDMNAPVTRAQFAQILANALPAEELEAINEVKDDAIPDVKMTEEYAAAVYRLYRAGVLTGNDAQGTFAPDNRIRRAEAAAIITRMAIPALRMKY